MKEVFKTIGTLLGKGTLFFVWLCFILLGPIGLYLLGNAIYIMSILTGVCSAVCLWGFSVTVILTDYLNKVGKK